MRQFPLSSHSSRKDASPIISSFVWKANTIIQTKERSPQSAHPPFVPFPQTTGSENHRPAKKMNYEKGTIPRTSKTAIQRTDEREMDQNCAYRCCAPSSGSSPRRRTCRRLRPPPPTARWSGLHVEKRGRPLPLQESSSSSTYVTRAIRNDPTTPPHHSENPNSMLFANAVPEQPACL